MYQVKFMFNGRPTYGIVRGDADAEGKVIVDDAVLPKAYRVPESSLTEIPQNWGTFNAQTGECDGADEYLTYIQDQFRAAQSLSSSLPGFGVGSMFHIGVCDGSAHYVVTKVNKRTCKVEWRNFGGDRYTDHWLGYGGSFPIEKIRRYVERERAADKLFRKLQAGK